MRPGVRCVGLGVVVQIEYFHDALPNRLTLPNLFDRDGLTVRSLSAVQMVNHVPQFV